MFKLGDFVRFVDEKREGYITRVIDAQTFGVTDTDGFEIPVAANNLTHVHGHEPAMDEGARPAAANEPETFQDTGVFLAVVPDGKASAVVHLFVLNRSSHQLLLSLKANRKQQFKGEFAGVVRSAMAIQLYAANLSDLDSWPEFIIQALYFNTGNREPRTPLLATRRFKARDFNRDKVLIAELNKYGWLFELDEPAPLIDPQRLKESFFRGETAKPVVQKPAGEIDLHIEKLRDDHHFLQAAEILKIQLHHFQQTLDAAIAHHLPSVIFIHGVGNGTLRHEIHKQVSRHPQVRTFSDARKEKFGYGATEVFFKT